MSNLITYLKTKNAQSNSAFKVVEDAEHWASYGVTTIAEYKRYNNEQVVWDLYKDVNGVRPRFLNFKEMSDTELQEMIDALLVESDEQFANDKEDQAIAIKEIESTIKMLIKSGASNRETAITWLIDNDEYENDTGMFEYSYNLPYNYLKEIN